MRALFPVNIQKMENHNVIYILLFNRMEKWGCENNIKLENCNLFNMKINVKAVKWISFVSIKGSSRFYIVENNEKVLAYMKLNFDKAQTETGHDNTLEIQRIYVLQEYKSKHIGKMLMQKAIEIGKNSNLNYIWLGVWEHNINAIKFYEKQGFEKFDTHIFKLGEDEQTDNLMKLIL